MCSRLHKLLSPASMPRARKIAREISPLLGGMNTVLDFGCGNMQISKCIHDQLNGEIKLTGSDIIDYNITDFDFFLSLEDKIPLKDNSFDCVIAVFTLHHTSDPRKMLKECIRVAKKKVILVEDVYHNKSGEIMTKCTDWLFNNLVPSSMDIPFNFLSSREWKEEFRKNNVYLENEKRIHPVPLIPIKNVMFNLKKY